MKRTVRREIIDEWLDEKYPNAMTKLSAASDVPASSIAKIRNGRVPKNADHRKKLAEALGVDEPTLFPVLEDREQAS